MSEFNIYDSLLAEVIRLYSESRPIVPGGLSVAMEVASGQIVDPVIAVGEGYLGVKGAHIHVPHETIPSEYLWPVAGQVVTIVGSGKLNKEWLKTLLKELLMSQVRKVWVEAWGKVYIFNQQDLVKML